MHNWAQGELLTSYAKEPKREYKIALQSWEAETDRKAKNWLSSNLHGTLQRIGILSQSRLPVLLRHYERQSSILAPRIARPDRCSAFPTPIRRMTLVTPDYADPQYWFVQPDRAVLTHATVFYVHPTTFQSNLWNQDLASSSGIHTEASQIVARQTACFASSCRIFAPRYRQASSRAFHERGTCSDAAYALAYGDVCAAFRHYMRHWHRGCLILVGHSQGALHIGRLLAELIEPQGLVPELIAAYAIGIGFSESLFGIRFRIIIPCERPDQTQCLVNWNTFLTGGDPSSFLQRTRERDAAFLGGKPSGTPICINPISFDANRPDMPGARVRGGVVWIGDAPADMPALPGGNMHMHDLALFEPSIGENVRWRLTEGKPDVPLETDLSIRRPS